MHADGWRCFVNVDVGSMGGVEHVDADGHSIVEHVNEGGDGVEHVDNGMCGVGLKSRDVVEHVHEGTVKMLEAGGSGVKTDVRYAVAHVVDGRGGVAFERWVIFP